jgi:hypothetical protein
MEITVSGFAALARCTPRPFLARAAEIGLVIRLWGKGACPMMAIDGRTIRLLDGEMLVITGITVPQISQLGSRNAMELGLLARDRLQALLDGADVVINRTGPSANGFTPVSITANGEDVAGVMIRLHHAVAEGNLPIWL